jgi:hypothetical protein
LIAGTASLADRAATARSGFAQNRGRKPFGRKFATSGLGMRLHVRRLALAKDTERPAAMHDGAPRLRCVTLRA